MPTAKIDAIFIAVKDPVTRNNVGWYKTYPDGDVPYAPEGYIISPEVRVKNVGTQGDLWAQLSDDKGIWQPKYIQPNVDPNSTFNSHANLVMPNRAFTVTWHVGSNGQNEEKNVTVLLGTPPIPVTKGFLDVEARYGTNLVNANVKISNFTYVTPFTVEFEEGTYNFYASFTDQHQNLLEKSGSMIVRAGETTQTTIIFDLLDEYKAVFTLSEGFPDPNINIKLYSDDQVKHEENIQLSVGSSHETPYIPIKGTPKVIVSLTNVIGTKTIQYPPLPTTYNLTVQNGYKSDTGEIVTDKDVFVNGQHVGKTPIKIMLIEGTYDVVVIPPSEYWHNLLDFVI